MEWWVSHKFQNKNLILTVFLCLTQSSQDDNLIFGLSMKHNVMTKFLLLNLGYTHHAIRIFGYMQSAIKQLV